jgi:hypothetical protein
LSEVPPPFQPSLCACAAKAELLVMSIGPCVNNAVLATSDATGATEAAKTIIIIENESTREISIADPVKSVMHPFYFFRNACAGEVTLIIENGIHIYKLSQHVF